MRLKRIAPCRDTASKWNPPDNVVQIAEERTAAIRMEFFAEAQWKPADFKMLAQSCYIQGMNDMVDAATKAGWVPHKNDPPAHMGDLP